MTEAIENAVVVSEAVSNEKPYKFRLLGAPDVFLMFKIISKIGVNEFMACFKGDGIKNMVKLFTDNGEGEDAVEVNVQLAGVAAFLEIANVIMGNLHKCEADIYTMLSNVSGMSVEEIKAPGNAVMFFEMVIDFIKKEEFADFIGVVSKLFK